MRFSIALLLAGFAMAGPLPAQDAPPAEPPAEAAAPAPGLSDLDETVEGLQDAPPAEAAPPAAEAPAPEPPAADPPPTEPPAEAPAEAAPAPETPAPETPAAEAPTPETPAPPPATPSLPPQPLTRAQRAQLVEAAQRGRLLGAIARAGQLGTQDMLSRVSDPEGAGITGWLAEPQGNGVLVTFYADGADGAPPAAVYRANTLGGRVVSREVFLAGDRPPLTAVQARMAAARAAAAGQEHRPCGGEEFNYLVVPPTAAAAPIDVYQVSPPTARNRLPVGGHYKTIVAADGGIASTRGYTNACLDLDLPEVAAGAQPRPLAITHLADPLPTEVHVFLSLLTGRPLVVVADDPQRLFQVTGEGIAEIPR